MVTLSGKLPGLRRPGALGGRPAIGATRRGAGSLAGLLETLYAMQARYESRRALAELDDRLLRDVGLDRLDAEREAAKPFWSA